MEIKIEYKTNEFEYTKSFDLAPGAYFDLLDDNENLEDDGVPKYNEPKMYLRESDSKIELDKIEYIVETISGSVKQDRRLKTVYFGQGQSKVIHRKDWDGYELIIQSYKIAQNCIHTSRIERDSLDSDWKITSSMVLNYEVEHVGKEEWYSSNKGEYLKKVLETD